MKTLSLQIHCSIYLVNLNYYLSFYQELDSQIIENISEYLNQYNQEVEEIQYTKYYTSPYYEYNSRGVITINSPFNGKVMATLKYKDNHNADESQVFSSKFLQSLFELMLYLNNKYESL